MLIARADARTIYLYLVHAGPSGVHAAERDGQLLLLVRGLAYKLIKLKLHKLKFLLPNSYFCNLLFPNSHFGNLNHLLFHNSHFGNLQHLLFHNRLLNNLLFHNRRLNNNVKQTKLTIRWLQQNRF